MPSSEHEALVEALKSAPLASGNIEDIRANYDAMLSANTLTRDASREGITIEHVDADWIAVPESRAERGVLYLHGGGYSIGSNVGYREFAGRVAQTSGVDVTLSIGEGLIHVWPVFVVPEAGPALAEMGAFVDQHI